MEGGEKEAEWHGFLEVEVVTWTEVWFGLVVGILAVRTQDS